VSLISEHNLRREVLLNAHSIELEKLRKDFEMLSFKIGNRSIATAFGDGSDESNKEGIRLHGFVEMSSEVAREFAKWILDVTK